MTKEIKATAPTPQDWIELVRENERLKGELKVALKVIKSVGMLKCYSDYLELENKTND